MNVYGIVLLIFIILVVLYWFLNCADKVYKCYTNGECDCFKKKEKNDTYENVAESPTGREKETDIEIPVKILSFKRAMHDISNNV